MAEESPVSDVAGKDSPRGTSPRKRQAIARPTPLDHAGAAAAAMSGLKNIPNLRCRGSQARISALVVTTGGEGVSSVGIDFNPDPVTTSTAGLPLQAGGSSLNGLKTFKPGRRKSLSFPVAIVSP